MGDKDRFVHASQAQSRAVWCGVITHLSGRQFSSSDLLHPSSSTESTSSRPARVRDRITEWETGFESSAAARLRGESWTGLRSREGSTSMHFWKIWA